MVLLMLLCQALPAVGLRVATFNIETNRNEQGWPNFALGAPGGVDFDSVAAILGRIDADVVALQEVHTSDLTGSPSEVEQLATALGLSHIHAGSNSGNFDTSLRVVFLSRYPFTSTASIFSPAGAKEISRHCPAVVVDVPGTDADPLMISAHLKSGTGSDDRFRRAIEMRRLTGYLAAAGLQASDNFIVLGDFNPSGTNRTFTTLPSGLPTTYSLGNDVLLPVE
ncbi:MAG: endonuclease/exonuclease/phosphatase family protein, partial [Haloferula sp.]